MAILLGMGTTFLFLFFCALLCRLQVLFCDLVVFIQIFLFLMSVVFTGIEAETIDISLVCLLTSGLTSELTSLKTLELHSI
jgi:hypothetical protein